MKTHSLNIFKTTLLLAAIAGGASSALAQANTAVQVEPDPVSPENQALINRCVDLYGEGFMPVGNSDACVKFSGEVRITYSATGRKTVTKGNLPGVKVPVKQ